MYFYGNCVQLSDDSNFNYFLTMNAIRIVFEGTPFKGGTSNIVTEIEVFQRNKCGCYPNGTVDGYRCLDGVCQCRELPWVDVKEAGPQCRPYLTRMIPTFGPRAGGTKVVIVGGFLGRENSSVSVRTWVGEITFKVEYSNETHVYSETPPQPQDGARRDIMYERCVLYSGGIRQTVIGRHMDSVAVPVLNVTLVYRGRHYQQTPSPCTVHNSTVIYCLTPKIQLPPEFAAMVAALDMAHTTPVTPYGIGYRMRRNADFKWPAGILNSGDLHFYLGLVLDGVPTYRNISKVLPEFGKLSMFDNPELYKFKDEIRLFRPYSPHDDTHIVIQGDRLNFGCKLDDYTVRLGKGLCPVVELKTNQIVCRPPQPKPPLGIYSNQGAHRVEVQFELLNTHAYIWFCPTYCDNNNILLTSS
ncbi:hypothetical protein NP493_619g02021 [Ridgeia piscesae]|uniref:IPT/TIG domain-containing protein n=1 Tax=Ridgeia piscesae TaxID=27915 RepID=A0AAD9KTB5_RIDPI|nr:hypothetical protein NP493_619g02021 [Ridgeia piscesae]